MTLSSGPTPSQTVGPYFTLALAGEGQNVVATADARGQRIRVEGRVLDGNRTHIEDALIELWQANADGRYHHPADGGAGGPADPAFTGFGVCASDFATGGYSFLTVKPGLVPHPAGGLQAPHLLLTIQARGMLNPTYTRVYFDDEVAANASDRVLMSVPEQRRGTLIASRVNAERGVPTYRFDIRYQGADETVFFDV